MESTRFSFDTSITLSAPNSFAFFNLYGTLSAPITVLAPNLFAMRIFNCPITPSPMTRTVFSDINPSLLLPLYKGRKGGVMRLSPFKTQAVGSTRVPSSKLTLSGNFKVSFLRFISGIRMYSEIPPGTIFVFFHVSHCTWSPLLQYLHTRQGA